MSNIKLYSYYRSSASFRVRIALALKNLKYEYIPVNLMKDGGEQLGEKYSAVNPMRQVPAIVIDGVTLTQSICIVEYIDEKFTSGTKILPINLENRALARSIAEIINSGIQPLQNLRNLRAVKGDPQIFAHDVIKDGFIAIESILRNTAKSYCVGDEISIADVCLVPQVYNANRFKVDMDQFPTISRISQTLMAHEAFKVAAPENQPDFPADPKTDSKL